mmetsp:Transcript_34142/g.89785  ORF Transcript_34142/g.89785 Transcript_34142/m.89785 type:complete len:202 (-) Transcript_34142:6-611(-)
MELPVGLGLKLVAEEPTVGLGELLGLAHHASAFAGLRRHDNLRAEHAHQLAALNAEGLSHTDDTVVATLRADHGNGNTRITGRRLDYRVPGFQEPLLLAILDYREREAVLDRRERIEVLALGVNLNALGAQLVRNLDDGRVADRLRNVIVKHTTAGATTTRTHAEAEAAAKAANGADAEGHCLCLCGKNQNGKQQLHRDKL